MNQKRRADIKEIAEQITALTFQLDMIKDQEDDARSNMPENLENSEQYLNSEDCSDAIEDTISDIDEAITYLLNKI